MDIGEMQNALEHLRELVGEYNDLEEELESMSEDVDGHSVTWEDFQVAEGEADELVDEIVALCDELGVDVTQLIESD